MDQVGVIAARAGQGSDEHYAALARSASVNQLRTAVKLEPRPEPDPQLEPQPSITKSTDNEFTCWRIKLPCHEAAKFDAALQSHSDALIAEWKRDHDGNRESDQRPPLPGSGPMRSARPHGHHTTVVMHAGRQGLRGIAVLGPLRHRGARAEADPPTPTRTPHRTVVIRMLDVTRTAPPPLHLGPLLTEAERRYLTCDATCEVWFERDGQVIGAGRATRLINRRLRRALEHRHPTCAVPGCGATRGLHAHHIRHWEDGGPTELANLVLVCPYHHRLHHRGIITIAGPSHDLTVTDSAGRVIEPCHHWRRHSRPRRSPHAAVHHELAASTVRPAANAPTGGGTNRSNHNHHRPTTKSNPAPPRAPVRLSLG